LRSAVQVRPPQPISSTELTGTECRALFDNGDRRPSKRGQIRSSNHFKAGRGAVAKIPQIKNATISAKDDSVCYFAHGSFSLARHELYVPDFY
jgi:hypothetical protein